MMKRSAAPLPAHVLALLAHAFAALAVSAQSSAEWSVDDILLQQSASELALSPDGRSLVYVLGGMDEDEQERTSNLVLRSLADERETRLTRGENSHSQPRWSPDGRRIAFLSDRPLPDDDADEDAARSQLWLIDPFGGEPWPAAVLDRQIREFAWLSSDTILFSAQEPPSWHEQRAKREKDTSNVVEDSIHEPPVRLFKLALDSKEVTRVTDNEDWIRGFALAPDGRRAIAVHQRSLSWSFDQRVPPVTMLHDLASGEATQLFDGTRVIPGGIRWAPDGRGFYFSNDTTTHPVYRTATLSHLYHHDLATGRTTRVDADWDRGLARDFEVLPSGAVLALLADGVYSRPARFDRRGERWVRSAVDAEHGGHIFDLELARDGVTLVYEHSRADRPPQLFAARLDGARIAAARQITDLNASLAEKPMPRVDVLRWVGARGDSVEGLLFYPLDYAEGRRYPLILSIHGGPASADMHRWDQSWSDPAILLEQKGAFVLKPNYHGSTNYGLAFVESICCGNYYDLEIPDILAGVDHVIGLGLAHPDSLGSMGWSNGAILTTELTTRTNRFKAASAGAGDVEWISDWANVDFGASFDNYYFGASPWEDPQLYIAKSPVFRMDQVETPTIIYFGTEDRNVPTDQGWTHFRRLQQLGQVPVRFILFPGEAHGLRTYAHQRRKVEEDLRWFETYLWGTYDAGNLAVKEGSPLDLALRARPARVGGRLGRDIGGVLVPELVRVDGHTIGRFEVTRAQFAAFDPSYGVPPGTEDYPANGISFERAQEYVRWLARHTGEPLALPNADQARALYEKAEPGNTLDRWAGYAPNLDDAERLRDAARALPGVAPLLEPVDATGQLRGDVAVYGLGGNVAEWAITASGAPVLLGRSADRPAADREPGARAAPEYRGLRVARRPPG